MSSLLQWRILGKLSRNYQDTAILKPGFYYENGGYCAIYVNNQRQTRNYSIK